MVGHTGVYDAIVKAVEKVDQCLKSVVEIGLGLGYEFLVIADHGNADFALNEDGSPYFDIGITYGPMIVDGKKLNNSEETISSTSASAKITPEEQEEDDEYESDLFQYLKFQFSEENILIFVLLIISSRSEFDNYMTRLPFISSYIMESSVMVIMRAMKY